MKQLTKEMMIVYDKTTFVKKYRYRFEWFTNTFCNVYISSFHRIDSVCIFKTYSTLNVIYWTQKMEYEITRVLISKHDLPENIQFLRQWIETYIMSDEGMYDIIVNRFLYNYSNIITIETKTQIRQLFATPEKRDDDCV